jgi:hypothetical protein
LRARRRKVVGLHVISVESCSSVLALTEKSMRERHGCISRNTCRTGRTSRTTLVLLGNSGPTRVVGSRSGRTR